MLGQAEQARLSLPSSPSRSSVLKALKDSGKYKVLILTRESPTSTGVMPVNEVLYWYPKYQNQIYLGESMHRPREKNKNPVSPLFVIYIKPQCPKGWKTKKEFSKILPDEGVEPPFHHWTVVRD